MYAPEKGFLPIVELLRSETDDLLLLSDRLLSRDEDLLLTDDDPEFRELLLTVPLLLFDEDERLLFTDPELRELPEDRLLFTDPLFRLEEDRLRFTLPELLDRFDDPLLTVPLLFELPDRLRTVEDDLERVVPLDLFTVPRLLFPETFLDRALDRTSLLLAVFLTLASDRVLRTVSDPRDVKPLLLGP